MAAPSAMPFAPQNLKGLMRAFATLGYRDDALLCWALPLVASQCSARAIPNAAASAVSAHGGQSAAFERTTAASEGAPDSRSAGAADFCSLAWSLAVLACCPPQQGTETSAASSDLNLQSHLFDGVPCAVAASEGAVRHERVQGGAGQAAIAASASDAAVYSSVASLTAAACALPLASFTMEARSQLFQAHMLRICWLLQGASGAGPSSADNAGSGAAYDSGSSANASASSRSGGAAYSERHSSIPFSNGARSAGFSDPTAALRAAWPGCDGAAELFDACLAAWQRQTRDVSTSSTQALVASALASKFEVKLEAPLEGGLLRTDILMRLPASLVAADVSADTAAFDVATVPAAADSGSAGAKGSSLEAGLSASAVCAAAAATASAPAAQPGVSHSCAGASAGSTAGLDPVNSSILVAVEVDGPSHFAENDPLHALGSTVARNRLLETLGGVRVVCLHHSGLDAILSPSSGIHSTFLAENIGNDFVRDSSAVFRASEGQLSASSRSADSATDCVQAGVSAALFLVVLNKLGHVT